MVIAKLHIVLDNSQRLKDVLSQQEKLMLLQELYGNAPRLNAPAGAELSKSLLV